MSQRYIGGLIYNPPGGFSGYFDGSGDFLTWTGTAAGSGAFCYEFWIFSQNGFATMRAPLGVIATSGYNSALDIRMTGSTINVSQYNVATNNFTVDPLQANTWYHIAVCRNASNQTTVFVNGVRSSTGAVTLATNFSGLTSAIGRLDPSNGGDVTGYISNVRLITGSTPYDPTQTTITVPSGPLQAISGTQFLSCAYPTFRDGSSNNFTITVNGNTAVSTQNPFPQTQLPNPALGNQGNGVYTMSQYQALRSQNLWPAIDPYFDYVTLMLHGNGTNGAQNNTFLDSSTNNFTITRNGNTTQGTFTPYGANWSNYFDGSGDYLSIPSSAGLRFDGQFCVEGWVNFNAFNTQNFLISQFTAAGEAGWLVRYTGTALRLYAQNGAVTIDRTWSPSRGVWYHFAVTRDSSNDIRFFIDGTQLGATATGVSTTMSSTNTAYIGGHPDIANDTNAYLSNMRVVKGSAVYTANFIPSTAPLTAITNTSLLTCQSNRFIDNSSNNFTITRNGDVSVQRFSPFNPTTPYAAGTIGGSGYFDGGGDYLSAASNAAFGFGTGDFTIEAWINVPSVAAASQAIVDTRSAGGSSAGFYFGLASATLQIFSSGSINLTGGTIVPSAWTHVAVTRSGTTVRLFVNGEQVNSTTNSTNWTDNNMLVGVAAGILTPITGYISSLRVLKGTAVYTSAFTPPTAPPTNITNTSLLLNFTNGGIIDNAMMNDLETVGNAQISTSVSKFGGGSLAFDGTGDWLLVPTNQNMNFGSGNFTIEMWIYPLNVSSSPYLIDGRSTSTASENVVTLYVDSSQYVTYWVNGAARITANSTVSLNAWSHVAVVKNGGITTMYLNGTPVGTWTDGTTYIASNYLIGQRTATSSQSWNGYIDDLRITKYARYTANFTPQRSQWQDQ